jgi:uncharacterized protein DUF1775
MRKGFAVAGATAAALALVPAAVAHVTLSPPAVEAGTTARIVVSTPNERPGHETVRVTVDMPPQVEIASAQAPPGWIVEHSDRNATWSGDRISGTATVEFPLELHGLGPAGAVYVTARQHYEDGADVTWQANLTVLPAEGAAAPRSHAGRALVAGIAGIVLVGGGLAVLHRLRRRPLPDR